MVRPEDNEHWLERTLITVQKPGRYVGGELNQVVKGWDRVSARVALLFPDIYDLGMSNLGLAILYDLLNQREDVLAERTFLPWIDMEAKMRAAGVPLYSLESKHPLAEFDILGISLPYETLYTNTLNALDLAGIPLFTDLRTAEHPLIIAGGHATFNPEPMHPFIDAFVIGEGEEVMGEIVDLFIAWRKSGAERAELLHALAHLWGVYVPSLYEARYHTDGTFEGMVRLDEDAPLPIEKRIVSVLPPPTTRFVVPHVDVVFNRLSIEIMRGCTRGCRFCHAGMVTRPVRERTVEEVIEAIERGLDETGMEEVGLLSLSSSDYTHVVTLVNAVSKRFADRRLAINLPSLRIETVSVDLMDALKDSRRSGFTLAPEAATEKMREIINKPVSSAQLLDTAREIYRRGWTTIKLYFMIGHPSETLEDVQAIIDLCKAVLKVGRREIGKRAKVHAGVSNFVPKPHTPFQWVACDSMEQMQAKQLLLKQQIRGAGLKLNWNDPEETLLEAWLSRGDRRLAEVVYEAWRRGAKFDAWQDQPTYPIWMQAFKHVGLDPEFYTHRPRPIDETFPWDHISTTVRKKFIADDYQWSMEGKTRIDCRYRCFACGVLPAYAHIRSATPGDHWQCPEVPPIAARQQARSGVIPVDAIEVKR